MKRVAATVAAVGLILLAVVVRSRLDTRNDSSAQSLVATVVCATELAPVCDELRAATPGLTVRTEDAGLTRKTLDKSDFNSLNDKIDAWLVPRPYPDMVAVDRQRASLEPSLDDESPVLARSPLVVAIWAMKQQVLTRSRCPDISRVWKCAGAVAGDPWVSIGGETSWGPVKIGLAPAERSATGLLTLAQASAQQIDRNDYSRADLEEAGYQNWLSKLEAGVPSYDPSTGTALGQMLSQGESTFDIAGSIEAIAGPAIGGSRVKNDLSILYPSPDATADVVAVAARGSVSGGRVTQLLQTDPVAEILARHGWRVDGQPVAAEIRDLPLPATNGLPDAGVFVALDEAWNGVHR